MRIRHHLDRRCSFLEVKTKGNGGKTKKARRRRAFGDTILSADDRAFVAQACGLDAARLGPSVWTNFRRATFVGVSTNERITVDLELTFQREVEEEALRRLSALLPRHEILPVVATEAIGLEGAVHCLGQSVPLAQTR